MRWSLQLKITMQTWLASTMRTSWGYRIKSSWKRECREQTPQWSYTRELAILTTYQICSLSVCMHKGSRSGRNLCGCGETRALTSSRARCCRRTCRLWRREHRMRLRGFPGLKGRSLWSCSPRTKTYWITCTTRCSTICAMIRNENRHSSHRWRSQRQQALILSRYNSWRTLWKCFRDRQSCATKCTTRLPRQATTGTWATTWPRLSSITSPAPTNKTTCYLRRTPRPKHRACAWRKPCSNS